MAASKTEICNISLGHVGMGVEVADVDTERSAEARACRRFYDTALRATLRDFNWPFAVTFADLSLIEEEPNDDWGYSYGLPVDCMKIIKILSGVRNQTRNQKVPYELSHGDSYTQILTDQEDAVLKYVKYTDNTARYTHDFVLAFSWRLASYIAPKLTKGDPFKLKEHCLAMYSAELSMAKGNALNEEQPDQDADGELVSSRA